MSNELTIWKDDKSIKDIKEIYGKTLSDSEFAILVNIGETTGLNPFNREIFAVKYGNNAAQIFIARDGYRKIAQKQVDYDGHFVDAVYSNDIFEMQNGNVSHKYNLKNRGDLIGAYCLVTKKNINKPFYVFVLLKEYIQKTKIWDEKPETMIKKVAESQSLRMSWQSIFANTYDESEQWDIDNDNNKYNKTNQTRVKLSDEANNLSLALGYKHINDCVTNLSGGKYKRIEDIQTNNLPKFIEVLKQALSNKTSNDLSTELEQPLNPSSDDIKLIKINELKSLCIKAQMNMDVTDNWSMEQIEQSLIEVKSYLETLNNKEK